MDNRGYSKRIAEVNANANPDSLGVQLGRYCIQHEIPIMEIARMFGVSRMSVYSWFTGKSEPRLLKYTVRIKQFLEERINDNIEE
jgi:hypothetical protein